jgi:hypothetical protein
MCLVYEYQGPKQLLITMILTVEYGVRSCLAWQAVDAKKIGPLVSG